MLKFVFVQKIIQTLVTSNGDKIYQVAFIPMASNNAKAKNDNPSIHWLDLLIHPYSVLYCGTPIWPLCSHNTLGYFHLNSICSMWELS